MLFNSISYLIFIPIVFFLYWFVFNKSFQFQNFLILVSSYIFYGWWDWRFLFLIFLSTAVDYLVGRMMYSSQRTKVRKIYLYLSILFNLSLLGFFKYYNFFIDSWVDLISYFGYQIQNIWTLKIILPVGISFYTFQTMSYTLDIYYKRLKPTKDFISFAAFVAFFPQLVAGPIERAHNLLPQILSKREFIYNQGVEGLRLILWGMFKKVVIADSLAWRVDYCFNNYQHLDGGTLILGLLYFSVQIYCDFSGYSDIAIGTAKLFGIELMSNFRFPYFSRNIGEFWKRWHISLSSWFRDYIYIPLGGSQRGKLLTIRNIFITFLISGFWHGANWTFIVWGLVHAILYIFLVLYKNKKQSNRNEKFYIHINLIKNSFQTMITFFIVMIVWVFFRSESILNSFEYLGLIISKFSIPMDNKGGILVVFIFFSLEWLFKNDERRVINFKNIYYRWFFYFILSFFCFSFFKIFEENQFLYFQF